MVAYNIKKMKYLIFLLALTFILGTGCGQNNRDSQQKEAPAAASAPQVAEKMPADTIQIADTAHVFTGSVMLTKDVFLKKVWDYNTSPQEWKYLGKKPAIIDFYADWCGPCRIASPILEKVAEEYAGQIIVYKINTDKERELASVFGIQSIPAFLYIPLAGKPAMMAGIARTEEETRQMFIDNISKYLIVPAK